MKTDQYKRLSHQRRAGVLLHPTSLPGDLSAGDIGHEAYRFIEFLHAAGFKVWQMLPLGPTHDDKSPYQCLSAHAANPLLISLDWLVDRGWLNRASISRPKNDETYRRLCLQQAAENFYQLNDADWFKKLAEFSRREAYWLDDYALFMALKKHHHNQAWYEWPLELRHRDARHLSQASQQLESFIKQTVFEQFVFFTQWAEIRDYAQRHHIELYGDMPIFVARDSADVWARRDNFLMDENGDMPVVAGVPPDAFSEQGQRWGNPLYNWQYMQADKFSWWKERLSSQLKLFDIIRIDHFRGLQACWQIPQADDTAMNGEWVETPGHELLTELFNSMDYLPLIAEDLGLITDEVIALKNAFQLPGMKVLQFAFDGNSSNPHLPHQHEKKDLVYTATHDNDTTSGWVAEEANYNKIYFEKYTGQVEQTEQQRVWNMIRMALSSVSFLCILPMQDLLMTGSSSRMNIPGTVSGNWLWRYQSEQMDRHVIDKISELIKIYQR